MATILELREDRVLCAQCGEVLQPSRFKPRKFCSASCKKRAYRIVKGRRHLEAWNPASPLCGASARPLARVRVNLPHTDVLGGHHAGSLDPDLRRSILAIEIGGGR